VNIEINLPTLHPGQIAAYKVKDPATGRRPRFLAIRCGRRWGKTDLGKVLLADATIKGKRVAWFAPDYRILSEAYAEILTTLEPVVKSSSKTEGMIRLDGGGSAEFWTLNNPRAGRSRKYHLAIIDEAAFTTADMKDTFSRSILPTLLDYLGSCVVLSNTNGVDPENFMWRICNEDQLDPKERHGFVQYHAPSIQNPYLPAEEIERLRRDTHPLVFAQEYEAEFIDWSGVAFFDLDKLLVNGQPVQDPTLCDAVFCTLDTATKTGSANDGTGVIYWARSRATGYPLVILDYELVQIEGSLLEVWLPTVLEKLEGYAASCRARHGSLGAFIEDKASGEILLQQAARRGLKARAIESRLTALGKDERAISVSGYHFRGEIKLSQRAYEKTFPFKGATRNHLVSQVTSFRIGDKDAAKRADDLLDCYTYGPALALGNNGGF